jgi:hypothetical protein
MRPASVMRVVSVISSSKFEGETPESSNTER